MIEARELRIGNLVCDIDGNVFRVDGISPVHIGTKRIDKSSKAVTMMLLRGAPEGPHPNVRQAASPIPLSDEWLKRFGFTRISGANYRLGNLEFSLNTGWINNGHSLVNNDNPVKTVHALQNLIYALTGKELEYKS